MILLISALFQRIDIWQIPSGLFGKRAGGKPPRLPRGRKKTAMGNEIAMAVKNDWVRIHRNVLLKSYDRAFPLKQAAQGIQSQIR